MFRMFLTFRVDAITSLSMYRAFHGMYRAKGQLISRRLFDVIVSTKKTNEISALASKKRSNQKSSVRESK